MSIIKIVLLFAGLIISLLAVAYISDKFKIGQKNVSTPAAGMTQQQLDECANNNYSYLGSALVQCVSQNYANCGLRAPSALPQHDAAPNFPRAIFRQPFGVVYIYMLDRNVYLDGQRGIRYSTSSIREMQEILNETLPNYCINIGLPPFTIVGGKSLDKGRVAFALAQVGGQMV